MDFEDYRDLFEKLPIKSREKVRILCDASLLAHEGVLAAWNRLNDERADLARVKTITANQKNAAAPGARRIGYSLTQDEAMLSSNRRALTDEDVEQINDRVRMAQERVDRADAARKAAEASWEIFGFLPEIVSWLEMYSSRGGRLDHLPLPSAKLLRGETFRQAVERVRGQLTTCDDEWARIEAAPLPTDELKSRITAEVEAIAALGQPKIQGQDRFGDGVSGLASALRLRRTGNMIVSDAPSPFLCWLHRDEIIARLCAEADALDQADAMTDAARDQAFSQLLDQKLSLEFEEESFVVAAAAEGTTIQRRHDCDPRAVLEIQEIFE